MLNKKRVLENLRNTDVRNVFVLRIIQVENLAVWVKQVWMLKSINMTPVFASVVQKTNVQDRTIKKTENERLF